MLRFIQHKIMNKKWLNGCLIIGTLLLTAVFSCVPCFKSGSLDQMLYMEFQNAGEEKNEFPAVLSRSGGAVIEESGSVKAINDKIDAYESKWLEYIEADKLLSQRILHMTGCAATTSLGGKNKYLDIGMIPDLDEHITIVKGNNVNDVICPEGTYPCYLNERTADRYNLVTGEILSLNYCLDSEGNPVQVQVAGIIREKDYADNFWYTALNDQESILFLDEEDFNTVMNAYSFEKVFYEEYMLLDYTGFTNKNAEDTMYYLEQFQKNDQLFSCNFMDILREYQQNRKTVTTILLVLILPVLVLLILFIYMVSGQILNMEQGEIATLKSRGVSRRQIIRTYLIQSVILSFCGMGLGIPAGYLLCKLAASTDAFFVFVRKDVSIYQFTWEMVPYALAAVLFSIFFMTIPVIKMSKLSIVEQKQTLVFKKEKMLWEKYFLDIILLIVSLYLLYNYNKQKDSMSLAFIQGKSFDPMVFLNASLFTLALGLFFLRLSGYIVGLIYYLGRKHWKPAIYASFLQIQRTAKKQGFISVFLVMTIAMGIFYSNMARTINENNEERIAYGNGAEVQVMEDWQLSVYRPDVDVWVWYYNEPDYEKLKGVMGAYAQHMTRVLEDDNTDVKVKGKTLKECHLMAVNTKEFGETARLKEGLNDKHWYYSLNSISQITNGVIISRNLADYFELQVGDTLTYSRFSPISGFRDEEIAAASGTVCAIVDAWPGYEQYYYVYNEEGNLEEKENYLLVANYATVVNTFGMTPYSVWMKTEIGVTEEEITSALEEQKIGYSDISSIEKRVADMKNSSMIQITNGMFTISFLVSVIICTVGFLIYWILSIRQRELLFGIYRAMGMSMKEVNKMLINEHLYSSLLAGIAGAVTGILATALFGELMALAYLPKKHNVPLEIFVDGKDMISLAVIILAVFLLCLIILRHIISGLKIAQALKMGED